MCHGRPGQQRMGSQNLEKPGFWPGYYPWPVGRQWRSVWRCKKKIRAAAPVLVPPLFSQLSPFSFAWVAATTMRRQIGHCKMMHHLAGLDQRLGVCRNAVFGTGLADFDYHEPLVCNVGAFVPRTRFVPLPKAVVEKPCECLLSIKFRLDFSSHPLINRRSFTAINCRSLRRSLLHFNAASNQNRTVSYK